MAINALFSGAGIDPEILAAVEAGQELYVTRRFKRAGVEYQSGDLVVLGDMKNDDRLCRGAGDHPAWVAPAARAEAQKLDHQRREYKRDVLRELESAVTRAATKHEFAKVDLSVLQSQAKVARGVVKATSTGLEEAQAALEAAQAEMPT